MTDSNLGILDQRTQEKLEKAGLLSNKAIIKFSIQELSKLLDVSQTDAKKVLQASARGLIKQGFISESELIGNKTYSKKWRRLTLGCNILDMTVRRGISVCGITELAGESGCGKTQLCLQLAITVQLHEDNGGFSSGAVFICTEDKFPSSRLQQIIHSSPLSSQQNIKFTDNIFIEHIADSEGLKHCVISKLPELLTVHKIGLIVIDSIAAVFRAEYNYNEGRERAKDLRAIGLQLHLISNKYNISVVCINQVTDLPSNLGEDDGTHRIPAMGLAWANLITCRLLMTKTDPHRTFSVEFAPDLPASSCQYVISKSGVKGLS